jgi:hypothetical protein
MGIQSSAMAAVAEYLGSTTTMRPPSSAASDRK